MALKEPLVPNQKLLSISYIDFHEATKLKLRIATIKNLLLSLV
jgi:hypothetical protein